MTSKTLPKPVILIFFILGLIGSLSFRAIIIANKFNQILARFIWYVGVISYLLFFAYRFYISLKRRKTITQNNLLEKIQHLNLSNEDKKNFDYVIRSIMKSREMFNYVFIFILSAIAIIIDIFIHI